MNMGKTVVHGTLAHGLLVALPLAPQQQPSCGRRCLHQGRPCLRKGMSAGLMVKSWV